MLFRPRDQDVGAPSLIQPASGWDRKDPQENSPEIAASKRVKAVYARLAADTFEGYKQDLTLYAKRKR